MILVNATKMEADYTVGVGTDGRELLVVAVKGTFVIPRDGEEPKLAEAQVPLVMSDAFTGEPGISAPLYEVDFPPRKPRCDVLLNGTAYAPRGKPVERVNVSLRVGSLVKSFDVVGPRVWQAGILYCDGSEPEPFTVMPISYNNAFGGADKTDDDPPREYWYPLNHVGVGYHRDVSAHHLDGKPLPNTEEACRPITKPNGKYRPMAFGPIGRAWQPRVQWAGTYDENWIDNVRPFLPADFDEQYYQAAPVDQQMEYPRGGEEVELINLVPQGRSGFHLPRVAVVVASFYRNGAAHENVAVMDTVLFEPDLRRFMLVWRATIPLRRNMFEIRHANVEQRT